MGIPPQALARVFEPFFSTKEKGTGLGLAFAQQVLAELGGTLACESIEGRGACFTVRLPEAAPEHVQPPTRKEEALPA